MDLTRGGELFGDLKAGVAATDDQHRTVGKFPGSPVLGAVELEDVLPELLVEGLEPHKVREVFMSTMQNPGVWIDVSECFERKLEGLRQHTSQVGSRFQ